MPDLHVSVRAADPTGGSSVEIAVGWIDVDYDEHAEDAAAGWATDAGYTVEEAVLDEGGASVYVETTDAVKVCVRSAGHGPAIAGRDLCQTCVSVDRAEERRAAREAALAAAPRDEHGVPYVDRWQYADALAAAGRTPVCDTCRWTVAPVSGGWAHSHASADALVTSDWQALAHRATVLGLE